ncbi:MAG: phosphatase [Candidatus Hydrogenedentota bacterium]
MTLTNRYADFHLHSNHSDGADSPSEVVRRAAEWGFSAVALTDHDTVSGVAEAQRAAIERCITLVPGTEISCEHGGVEVHVLGLGIDITNAPLLDRLAWMQQERMARAARIVEKLNALGIPIAMDRVLDRAAGGASVGRLHIAQELFALGKTKTVQDAFDKYIGARKPAFVPRGRLKIEEAIERIHGAEGIAILAHPGLPATRKKVQRLLQYPFDGIEVYHTKHTPGLCAEYLTLAKANGLLVSGGSDCHGNAKGLNPEMGKVRLAHHYVDGILARIGNGDLVKSWNSGSHS